VKKLGLERIANITGQQREDIGGSQRVMTVEQVFREFTS